MIGVRLRASERDDTLTPLPFDSLSLAPNTVCVIERAICMHYFALEHLSATLQAPSDLIDGLVPGVQCLKEDGRPSCSECAHNVRLMAEKQPQNVHLQRGAPPFFKKTRRTAEQTTRIS
jgi:hypothetical protein